MYSFSRVRRQYNIGDVFYLCQTANGIANGWVGRKWRCHLPALEFCMVVIFIRNHSCQVKVMVGGHSFKHALQDIEEDGEPQHTVVEVKINKTNVCR